MDYVLVEWTHDLVDEPTQIYSELDESRQEVRKVEFYRDGLCFACGGEFGRLEALADVPFPEDLRTLNRPGEIEAHTIPRTHFQAVWAQAQERPDGFMGMLV